MLQADSDALRALWEDLKEHLDCGDSGCPFARKNEHGVYGMRTNGGCRLQKDLQPRLRRPMLRFLLECKRVFGE